MLASIHVNDAVAVGASDVHDENALEFGHVHKLNPIRREELTRSTRRLTARMGLELILPAVGVQLPSPIQKGNLGELGFYGSSCYGSRSTAVAVGILCKGRGTR